MNLLALSSTNIMAVSRHARLGRTAPTSSRAAPIRVHARTRATQAVPLTPRAASHSRYLSLTPADRRVPSDNGHHALRKTLRAAVTPRAASSSSTTPIKIPPKFEPVKRYGHYIATLAATVVTAYCLALPLGFHDSLSTIAASSLNATAKTWMAAMIRFAGAAHLIVVSAALSLGFSPPQKMRRVVEGGLFTYGAVVLATSIDIIRGGVVASSMPIAMYAYGAYLTLFYAFCLVTD